MAVPELAAVDFTHLRCPVLIIAGDRDGFMDVRVGESMKHAIGNAEMEVLHTGHAAAIEEPEAFNETVLRLLKKVDRPG